MKEQKKFKDLNSFLEEVKSLRAFKNVFLIGSRMDEDEFDEEIKKMYVHMTKTLENITNFKIAQMSFDYVSENHQIIFIFEATNVRYEDERYYVISSKDLTVK